MNTQRSARVFVGVRATLAGYQALRYAAEEARRRDGILWAVRAYDTPGSGAVRREDLIDTAAAEIGMAFLTAFGGMPAGLTVKLVAREGTAGRVLTSVADRADDVIVIGGSGPRRLFSRRRAAVARYCSRSAACPVVVVPPPPMVRGRRPDRLASEAEDFLRRTAHEQRPAEPVQRRPRSDDRP